MKCHSAIARSRTSRRRRMPQHETSEGSDRTSGYIRDAAEAAKAGVDRASDYLEGVTDQATGYMKRAVSDAQETVADLGSRRFEDVWGDLLRYTKRRPATALLVAGAIGLTLGLFARRG
jgi:ElaB/YqjD/DUF883 family membrane-anchored ribosome-binding protein